MMLVYLLLKTYKIQEKLKKKKDHVLTSELILWAPFIFKTKNIFFWTFFCACIDTFFKLIFVGGQLLYNVVLVSAVQQSASAVRIHISPLFWISFPFRSPQSIEQSSLCYTAGSHQISVLYIVCICQSQSPNSSHPAQIHFLKIELYYIYCCMFCCFILFVFYLIKSLLLSGEVRFFCFFVFNIFIGV